MDGYYIAGSESNDQMRSTQNWEQRAKRKAT